MDEQDTTEAQWAEQQNQERHHREDAGLERHRILLQEFRRETAEWLEEMNQLKENCKCQKSQR